MSDFFGKLKSGAGKVAFDADKMGRVNKAKGEIGKYKQQIEALYLKLGEITYNQFANPSSAAPDITETCQTITDLNRQIAAKNDEIQRINAETYAPQGAPAPAPIPPVTQAPPPATPAPATASGMADTSSAAPGGATKFCTNCGKEMAVAVKFCPDCGTKMA
jgi:hypothetical protein